MSDSRSAILASLRAARPPARPRPAAAARAPAPPARDARFIERAEAAGGKVVHAEGPDPTEALDAITGFASSAQIWSGVEGIAPRGCATSATRAGDLAELGFCVLPGELGVAESGAVWCVPTSRLERAAAVLCEHLVLLLSRDAIVPDLHDAYARIDPARAGFGWFLAGPSKTADIEQSLVLGAHGARALTVLLR